MSTAILSVGLDLRTKYKSAALRRKKSEWTAKCSNSSPPKTENQAMNNLWIWEKARTNSLLNMLHQRTLIRKKPFSISFGMESRCSLLGLSKNKQNKSPSLYRQRRVKTSWNLWMPAQVNKIMEQWSMTLVYMPGKVTS